MRLSSPLLAVSDAGSRIEARLAGEGVDERLCFAVPRGWSVSTAADPFVPAALVVAASTRASLLEVEGAVSEQLVEGLRRYADRVAAHLGLPPVEIVAPDSAAAAVPDVGPARRTGLCFSRGVDSSACLLLADRGELSPRPTVAVVVRGIDGAIPPDDDAVVARRSVAVAQRFGLDALVVDTNLRSILDRCGPWQEIHGAALAGAAHAVAGDLADVVVASADAAPMGFDGVVPFERGSHDSEAVRFHLALRDLDRSDRVRMVVEDGRLVGDLRVCLDGGRENCGRCRKCRHTAVLIEACGGDLSATFGDHALPSPEAVRRDPPPPVLSQELADAARDGGLIELADAVAETLETHAGRPAPPLLHAARGATVPSAELRYLLVTGDVDDARLLAETVEVASGVGPGCVLHEPATHVRSTAMRSAAATLWLRRGSDEDARLAVEAVRWGSEPILVVEPGVLDTVRSSLPPGLETMACTPGQLAERLSVAGASWERTRDVLVSGGHGWLGGWR